MTDFTINVRPDPNNSGTNKIELFLNSPKRELMILTERGDDLPPLDEEIRPEDEALYYAVERIAQLEAERDTLAAQMTELNDRLKALHVNGQPVANLDSRLATLLRLTPDANLARRDAEAAEKVLSLAHERLSEQKEWAAAHHLLLVASEINDELCRHAEGSKP